MESVVKDSFQLESVDSCCMEEEERFLGMVEQSVELLEDQLNRRTEPMTNETHHKQPMELIRDLDVAQKVTSPRPETTMENLLRLEGMADEKQHISMKKGNTQRLLRKPKSATMLVEKLREVWTQLQE